MPVSTDRVVCIPVKLDIPAHPEMLQEHACRLDSGVGMISIVQVTTRHEKHAFKVGQITFLISRQEAFILVNLLPFSRIFVLLI